MSAYTKAFAAILCGTVLGAYAGATLPACSPAANRAVVRTVVDVLLAECVAEHTEIEKVEELEAACGVAQDMRPVIEQLLAARKKGMVRAGVNPGLRDGGF